MSVSERLKSSIDHYFAKASGNASAKLSVAANCGQRLIYRVKNEGHIPRPDVAYRLAKACGWAEKDAFKLSQEILAIEVSETA